MLAGVDIDKIATEAGQAEIVTKIIEAVSEPVLNVIATVIAYIVLHLVVSILLTIIFAIINSLVEGGFVGFVNRVLGAVIMTTLSDLILNLPILQEQQWVQEFSGFVLYPFFKNLSPIDILLSF